MPLDGGIFFGGGLGLGFFEASALGFGGGLGLGFFEASALGFGVGVFEASAISIILATKIHRICLIYIVILPVHTRRGKSQHAVVDTCGKARTAETTAPTDTTATTTTIVCVCVCV